MATLSRKIVFSSALNQGDIQQNAGNNKSCAWPKSALWMKKALNYSKVWFQLAFFPPFKNPHIALNRGIMGNEIGNTIDFPNSVFKLY